MGVNYSGNYATPRLDLGQAWMEYMQNAGSMPEFVATEILPIVPVSVQAGKFSAITRDKILTTAATARAARSGYNRVDFEAEDKSFACEEHGLEGTVDDRERIFYQNDFDHELATLLTITRKLRLAQEVRVATAIFDTSVWTGSSLTTDVSGSAPWDTASSKVIANVIAAKEKVRQGTGGLEANALIVGRAQLENLLKNDEIRAQFPGAPLVTQAMLRNALAAIFGLDRLIVGNASKNTADEGLTPSFSDVWSDDYAMIARVANAGDGLLTPCVGRTFQWTLDAAGEYVVETYREEQVRGDVMRARHDVDEVILGAEFGHLLKID